MVATLAVGLILVACGGAAQTTNPNVQSTISPSSVPAATLAPTPAPPPTPTPEPTPDLVAIGQQYLKMANDLVSAQSAANAALDKATNDKAAIAAFQQHVDAETKAIADLGAIEFPSELQDERDAIVEGFTITIQVNKQLVKDPNDPDPTIDTRLDAAAAKIGAAGAAIRAALGLPPSSGEATASPSSSAGAIAAACMDKATLDLLMNNFGKLDELSAAQLARIVAAIKAYDFPAGSEGADWRDYMVAAIDKGDFYQAGLGATSIMAGSVILKACP